MIQEFLGRLVESKKQPVGIAGFRLFARTRDVTNYKSQAPTTYLEDGSPVQDHIINDPLTITIEGNVGDVYQEKSAVETFKNKATSLLGQASQYLPAKTFAQLQKVNSLIDNVRDKVRKIQNAVRVGTNVLAGFGIGSPTKSNQEKFVDLMEAIYNSKALVTIEMNYRTFEMMRITDLTITKDASDTALKFSITAQKIRTAQLVYKKNNKLKKKSAGGVASQTAAQSDKGAQAGKSPNASLLSTVTGFFRR